MSTSLTLIFLIYTTKVHSFFNQTLCFPTTSNLTNTILFPSYHSILTTILTPTGTTFNIETSSCKTTPTLPTISTLIYTCFQCSLDPSTPSTQTSRYTTLSQINNNLPTIIYNLTNTTNTVTTNLSYITYAIADPAPANPLCAHLTYPKICRFDLSAASISNSIPNEFLFTLSMNTTSQILSFEVVRADTTISEWFGIGFGAIGMDGDAVIYTCGVNICATPEFKDYRNELVNGERHVSGVLDDISRGGTDDLYNRQSRSESGSKVFTFQRVFDTNDVWDKIFTGEEESVYIHAAVGVIGNGLAMANHGSSHFVRPILVPFVKGEGWEENKWCVEMVKGDCIYVVNEVWTGEPSVGPSGVPSVMPVATKTGGAGGYTRTVLGVFLVVLIAVNF